MGSETEVTKANLRAVCVQGAPVAVNSKGVARPQANAIVPVQPQVTTPPPVGPAGSPDRTQTAAPTARPPATLAPTQAPAAAVPTIAKPAPNEFRLFAPKVNRGDLAAIFANGRRLARKHAAAALKAPGVKQTTAYNPLRDGERFADLLEVGADGLLAFKPWRERRASAPEERSAAHVPSGPDAPSRP